MEYLLQSSIYLGALTVGYWLLIRRETFYRWNRLLLIGIIGLALVLPLVPMPTEIVRLKEELIGTGSQRPFVGSTEAKVPPRGPASSDGPNEVFEVDGTTTPFLANGRPINWLVLIYGLGIVLLAFKFIVQLGAVLWQIRRAKIHLGKHYHLAQVTEDIAPYSFGKYIVLNPDKYEEEAFLQILEHEKAHIKSRHTSDLILGELLTIFQWFNPFAWLHRYLTIQNLEFQADQSVLNKGEDRKAYQYQLIRVAVPNYPLSITTNYNQSLIKKRIMMMNRKRSSLNSVLKYAFFLPLIFGLMTVMAQGATAAEEATQTASSPAAAGSVSVGEPNSAYANTITGTAKASNAKARTITRKDIYVLINEETTETELKELQIALAEKGLNVKYKNKSFNNGLLRTLNLEVKGENNFYGYLDHSFEENPGSKVYLYHFLRANRSFAFGIGNSSDIETAENIPEKAKELLQLIDKGYMFVNSEKPND